MVLGYQKINRTQITRACRCHLRPVNIKFGISLSWLTYAYPRGYNARFRHLPSPLARWCSPLAFIAGENVLDVDRFRITMLRLDYQFAFRIEFLVELDRNLIESREVNT